METADPLPPQMERREQFIRRRRKIGVKNSSQSWVGSCGKYEVRRQEAASSKGGSRSQGSRRPAKEDWKLEVGRVLRKSEWSIA